VSGKDKPQIGEIWCLLVAPAQRCEVLRFGLAGLWSGEIYVGDESAADVEGGLEIEVGDRAGLVDD
jgi:hypothetical protein